MHHDLTTVSTALSGVTDGTTYALQNRSDHTVYFEVAAAAPADTQGAFALDPRGPLSVGSAKADAGESIWAWADGATGSLVFDEAP